MSKVTRVTPVDRATPPDDLSGAASVDKVIESLNGLEDSSKSVLKRVATLMLNDLLKSSVLLEAPDDDFTASFLEKVNKVKSDAIDSVGASHTDRVQRFAAPLEERADEIVPILRDALAQLDLDAVRQARSNSI